MKRLHIIGILSFVLISQWFWFTWKTPLEFLTLDIKRYAIQNECNLSTTKHIQRTAVPKIVHYIWFYKKPTLFRFHHLIPILSTSTVIKPVEIIVWNSVPPTGPYWKEATQKIQNLSLKHREIPFEIFGNRITVPEHQSSLSRLDVLIEHGGIYLDFDVVVLSPLEPLLQYDVTLGRESTSALCNSVILAKKNAVFLRIWHQTYMNFSEKNLWGEHSVLMPYRLWKLYPELVHVEEDSMQRPNTHEIKWIYNPDFMLDWKPKYTLHLWYRFYNKDHTPSDIKMLNSILGYVFRYIYYGRSDLPPNL